MGSTAKSDGQLNIDDETINVTSLDKILYPQKGITKQSYLHYLIQIHSFMLPFLKNRWLTVKRYPHGMHDDFFYQKNCPDYAPDFVETNEHEGIRYIVCNALPPLVWLGNQLALEYHIPFNTIQSSMPAEIVFDLDPPSREQFSLAVEAAILIKDILDRLKLHAFVKTSGNKGIQVYVPLPDDTYTYDETRMFTHFVATYLVEQNPEKFTIERLKQNRGSRCYIDYIQHAEGKTIIAPYSLRGNDEALVATPLQWDEVKPGLRPEQFSMHTVLERVAQIVCPFAGFEAAKEEQPFRRVLEGLEKR
ncbi:non-homologous end-joining DNA ligase [Alkalihalobacillus sp. AL-G]|uniref:non-homologous end-joining DNA ligase n=1 Tax=Alkalihalobacillus sp. AL-G TaxID=2926399 RepID=UPI00272ADC70|nr:non-homologous end-joining DNA ligase [Alkalihalobacillus sp. AL-G]WLD94867.1 non-homologous end-joining DNA ligase [Alkalihalobacillus sp. AL-G]